VTLRHQRERSLRADWRSGAILESRRDERETVSHRICCPSVTCRSAVAVDVGLPSPPRTPTAATIGAEGFRFTGVTVPHVRIRHHHGAIHKKASLRRQHPVQKLAILQRTARPKAICPQRRCRRGRAEGHRKRFGTSTHPLIRFVSLTPI
jgi:hypothetical protein